MTSRVWLLQRNDVLGGTKGIIDGLAQRLANAGLDARQVYLRTTLEHSAERDGVVRRTVASIRDIARLLRRFLQDRPKVIVTFTPLLGALVGFVFAFLPGVRVISTLHTQADRVGAGARRLDSIAARIGAYSRIIACSSSVAVSYSVNGPRYVQQVTVIPNGAESTEKARMAPSSMRLRKDLAISDEMHIAFAAGRLTASKNLEVLMEALTLTDSWGLVVAGGGEMRARLQARARSLEVSHRISFLDRITRAQVGEWLSICDAYVQPSLTEGLSMALLEAMAHGAPVVASDIPENREPVTSPEGLVGWLVPAREPEEWARVLNWIGKNRLAAEGMGVKARDWQRRSFDQEAMYKQYIKAIVDEFDR